ncbi:MAG: hypothetical protein AB7W16_24040 [Candidatus Obscuribacterales bacterium]
MRVSAVLLGVNVAATLSVAIQANAEAKESPRATADFLKSGLAELSATPRSIADPVISRAPAHPLVTPSAKSLSSPKSVATRAALGGKSRMMPFVPNRKLPSKRELAEKKLQEQQQLQMQQQPVVLMAQTPQMEPESQPLMGTVSQYSKDEYSKYYMSQEAESHVTSARARRAIKKEARRMTTAAIKKAADIATAFVPQTTPRLMPGQAPATAGQIGGHPCASLQSLDLRTQDSLVSHGSPAADAAQMRASVQASGQAPQMSASIPQAPLTPPHLTSAEHQQLDSLAGFSKQAQLNSPLQAHMVDKGRMDGLYSRVGPPPFPLNMVPESVMKEFLSQARNRKSMISSYPGTFATGSSGLGSSGFQSHAGANRSGGTFTSYAHKINGFGSYGHHPAAGSSGHHAPAGHAHKSAGTHTAHGKRPSSVAPGSSTQFRSAPDTVAHKAEVKVASYAPYSSNLKIEGL